MSTENGKKETTTTFKEKPNELKIFKTRKEIKECKEEGRVSPTKKIMDSKFGTFIKNLPNFTSFKSSNTSNSSKRHSQSPQRPLTVPTHPPPPPPPIESKPQTSPTDKNSPPKSPTKSPPPPPKEASLTMVTERKPTPLKVTKSESSALIPTHARNYDNVEINGLISKKAIVESLENTEKLLAKVGESKSFDEPRKKSESPTKPANDIRKFSQDEILSDAPLPPPESTVQSNGIESRISQTIIMKKKRADSSADAIIVQRLTSSPTKFNEISKDMFVFTSPHKAKVSATVTLDRPAKLTSQAASSKSTNAIAASATVSALAPEIPSRSVSSTQLVPHMATNSVKSGSSCTLVSTTAASQSSQASAPTVNASVGNSLTVTTIGTDMAVSSDKNLSTNTISTTYSANSLPPAMPVSSTSGGTGTTKSSASSSTGSFADKLSRSFFDLTQGSQDRLQKWKNKLQSGKRGSSQQPHSREKDGSEPPPNRKMSTLSGNFLGESEVLVDWSTRDSPEKPRFLTSNAAGKINEIGPRPLHATKSASGALARDFEPFVPIGGSPKIDQNTDMEHRTLKQRNNLHAGSDKNLSLHYQNMKNLQQLVQTIEGYSNEKNRSLDLDLPPPARIMPFSGIKPQDDGIIRPIAFRPNALSKNAVDRQSFNSESVSFFGKSQNGASPLDVHIEHKPLSQSKSTSNIVSTAAASNPMVPLRTRPIPQPSTSSNSSPGNLVKRSTRQVEEENEYDTVPEYFEGDRVNSSDGYQPIYPYHQQQSNHSSLNRRSFYSNSTDTGHSTKSDVHMPPNGSASKTNSPQSNGIRKSASGHHQNGQRNSFGLHITPSPSDSGIVDYESLIRDKENELSNVRQAMEHNEEALVRVYQEKESQYKDQLTDLKQRLQVSQQGEATLRQQLSIAEDQRKSLQNTIQSLNNDKRLLQQKCQQIERDLYNIRNRFDDFVRETSLQQQRTAGLCESCMRQRSNSQSSSRPNESFYENNLPSIDRRNSAKAPMPAPRMSKESSADRELRSEVDDLRSEISSLRDQLNNQIQFFAEERRRWENERANIVRPPPQGLHYDVRNNNEHHLDAVSTGALNGSLGSTTNNPYRPEKRCAVLYGNDRLI